MVHEAYLRLVGDQQFDGRSHFFAAAAEAMRRILVESARRKKTVKHGGGMQRNDARELAFAVPEPVEDLIALDEVLQEFSEIEPQKARLVKLRYFVGFGEKGFRVPVDPGERFLADSEFLLHEFGEARLNPESTREYECGRDRRVAQFAIDTDEIEHQVADVVAKRVIAVVEYIFQGGNVDRFGTDLEIRKGVVAN